MNTAANQLVTSRARPAPLGQQGSLIRVQAISESGRRPRSGADSTDSATRCRQVGFTASSKRALRPARRPRLGEISRAGRKFLAEYCHDAQYENNAHGCFASHSTI